MINTIAIDFDQKQGPIRPMHSVNNGPAGSVVRGTSNAEAFRNAGIPYVRNHDASFSTSYGGEYTVDVHRIFRDFDADENNPESYDFLMTDLYMKDVYDVGSKMFYRLGARIEHEPRKCGTIPPKDFAKWARICEHIIRHYTEGWADGFFYDVEYWEIWNEPDCRNRDGSNPCWQGTDEQFFELFDITAHHLKACFPHLKIGGPALTGIWLEGSFLQGFFPYLQAHHTPLDFFSFHGYKEDPSKYAPVIATARELCRKYGYLHTELILNEWNYIRGWFGNDWKYSLQMEKSLKGASFIAGTMCTCQAAGLDHLMYYDARPCAMNGMFQTDTLEPLKGYYPFWMFKHLYQLGTEVACTCDDATLYACAAEGTEGAAVLLTYYEDLDESDAKEVHVTFDHMDAPNGVRVEYYLLDQNHDAVLVRDEIFNADHFGTYLKLNLFTTYLLKIVRL